MFPYDQRPEPSFVEPALYVSEGVATVGSWTGWGIPSAIHRADSESSGGGFHSGPAGFAGSGKPSHPGPNIDLRVVYISAFLVATFIVGLIVSVQ